MATKQNGKMMVIAFHAFGSNARSRLQWCVATLALS